jgi:CheY-like chemotaxis protein
MIESQAVATPRPEKARVNGRVRVLILDDEPCISELLGAMLGMLGYLPTKCFAPTEALELLEREEFEVILTDFRMPQMNGDEFFKKVVAKFPELAPRIVFLTGDALTDDTQFFLKKNSSRHLSKPFDLSAVQQVIAEILDNRVVAA